MFVCLIEEEEVEVEVKIKENRIQDEGLLKNYGYGSKPELL